MLEKNRRKQRKLATTRPTLLLVQNTLLQLDLPNRRANHRARRQRKVGGELQQAIRSKLDGLLSRIIVYIEYCIHRIIQSSKQNNFRNNLV